MSVPFVKLTDFTYGQPDQLSPLITRVICNNPGPFTYTGTGTYLIGTKELAVIDPGPADLAHTDALLAAAGDRPITHILVTHTHLDHSGGVADLKVRTGATVYAYGGHPACADDAPPVLEEGGDEGFRPDVELRDGDVVSTDEWTLKAIYTPGHISNHLCFALEEENALFSGDHIMGWATTVVVAPEGNMQDYISSLDILLERDDRIYYPTHGAPVENPHPFVRAVRTHRKMRDRQILDRIGSDDIAIMALVEDIYKDTDKRLHFAAAMNVHAHLECHVTEGRIQRTGDGLLQSSYRRAAD